MRVWVVVMAAVIAALGAAVAGAYPTFDGPSGLVTLPTAEVVPSGAVDLAVDYQKTTISGSALGGALDLDAADSDITLIPIRAAFGVGEGLEIWGSYDPIKVEGSEDAKLWNAGLKWAFMRESGGDDFSLAIGGSMGRMESDIDDVDITRAFLVASKVIKMKQSAGQPLSAMAHLGVMWAKLGEPTDNTMTKPFVGIEFFGGGGASLALEYRFEDDDLDVNAPFSAALRYPIGGAGSPLWIQVGATNAATGIGNNDNDLFFGLGYRFNVAGR